MAMHDAQGSPSLGACMAMCDAQGPPSLRDPEPALRVLVHFPEQAKHIQKFARISALNFSQESYFTNYQKAIDEGRLGVSVV